MAQSTQLEVLIAEMLGDVGKLHDQVRSLNETLPGQAERFEEKLKGSTSALLIAAAKLAPPKVYGSRHADEEVARVVERLDGAATRVQFAVSMLNDFESSMRGTAKIEAKEIAGKILQDMMKRVESEFSRFDERNSKAWDVVEESKDLVQQSAKAFRRVAGWGERWAVGYIVSISVAMLVGTWLGHSTTTSSYERVEQACTAAATVTQTPLPAKPEVGIDEKRKYRR